MLSIGKLGSGAEEYYLGVVASGREDYYTGSGETPGVWLGRGAERLGLAGAVNPANLRSILGGRRPGTEADLVPRRANRVAGFDLTFSAPKSVSVLWGLGLNKTTEAVQVAHDRAVEEATSYLQSHALSARRGHNGAEPIATNGFVAAAFRHRTSRAMDPQLHTHVLVANVVEGVDGRWSAPDARLLYHHGRAAGFVYQSALRAGLTESLGVRFTHTRKGVGEIVGIPDDLVTTFSTRRHQIEEALLERGERSAHAAEVAALATRQRKPAVPVVGSLRDMWAERSRSLGIDPEVVEQTLGNARRQGFDRSAIEQWFADLVGPYGLTHQASVFEPRHVMAALAERCRDGAHLADLEGLHGSLLLHSEMIRLGGAGPGGEGRMTTAELLAVEQRLLVTTELRRTADAGTVRTEVLDEALADFPQLSTEQRRMVHHVTTGGAGVDAVIGSAGAGKTFALSAARAAWELEGYVVRGATLSARAAQQLHDGAQIESSTLAGLLRSLESRQVTLTPRDVVVVDEAGMVGTRDLSRLVESTGRAEAKLLLVGDPKQLPEIETGGAFGAIARELDAPMLSENRRQHESWERSALAELRHGDVEMALTSYQRRQRVHVEPDLMSARSALVAGWLEARRAGSEVRMLAATRGDVDALNREARRSLISSGELGPVVARTDDFEFRVGDYVVCTSNDREIGVLNGTRGTVATPSARGEVMLTVAGGGVRLPSNYVTGGRLVHGYATTIHKSQGETVDRAFVLVTPALYREAGYVALSRAKVRTELYVSRTGLDDDVIGQHRRTSTGVDSLYVSRAKEMASEDRDHAHIRWAIVQQQAPGLGLR